MNLVSPIVAILTPFDEEGRIDYDALTSYLEFLATRGVKNIITNGTTGEFSSLTLGQRKSLLEHCSKNFAGTIVNHISSTCLQDSCELASHSSEYSQFNLVLPPYYYANPSPEGVKAFFTRLLEASSLPVFLYNFPLHTQYCLQPEQIVNLKGRFPNLVGIKDSSGSLELAKTFRDIDDSFMVFVGNVSDSLAGLQAGLSGSVTGAGNCFPECLVKIRELFISGQELRAESVQKLFNKEWNSWRKGIPVDEISLTKCALSARLDGFPVHVQPPIVELNEKLTKLVVEKTLDFQHKLAGICEQKIIS